MSKSLVLFGVLVLSVGGLSGCGGDAIAPKQTSEAQLFWSLRLNQHAITFAVSDTMSLHVVARNPAGNPLPLAGAVQYQVGDSSVAVDTNGLVTGKYETVSRGQPTYVIASVRDAEHNKTLKDTVFIQVTPTRPSSGLETISIQLDPSDSSTTRALDYYSFSNFTITPTVHDSAGNSMNSVLVALTSSDPTISTVSNYLVNDGRIDATFYGSVAGVRTGTVTFYGESWAYGVDRRDSIRVTWTNYANMEVDVYSTTPYNSLTPILNFYPQIITVAAGGVVTWRGTVTDSIDVIWDNTANVDSAAALNHPDFGFPYTGTGNFSGLFDDTATASSGDFDKYIFHVFKARRFPVPGTYHYHSTRYSATGTIIVQ